VVYGAWAQEGGYHATWDQEGFYHYYPRIEQVKAWVQLAGFRLMDETAGEAYHHFLVQRH
jgi:hypothetical protein